MNITHKRIILEICVFFLILLFGYAALSKLLDYNNFVVQLSKSPLVKGSAQWIGWAVPTIELIACILLISPKWRSMGLCLSFILMLAFTLYIAGILTFIKELPCSCGGILSNLTWKSHLIFNVVYTGISLTGIWIQRQVVRQSKVAKPNTQYGYT